ncbi:MAG: patatin-like phospholipase family protein [Turicibacter sp.]
MKKVGLVLSGGGAKGAFQIGAFKALEELGIDHLVGAISGASIGALNGALFIQYQADEAEKIWKSINWTKVLQLGDQQVKKLSSVQQGVRNQQVSPFMAYASLLMMAKSCGLPLKRDGFKLALKKCISLQSLSNSPITFIASCENVRYKTRQYFEINGQPPKKIVDILLASTAIPVIYQPVFIEGHYYGDPLKVDNVPITPLIKTDCDTIIVIHLDKREPIRSHIIYEVNGKTIIHISPSQDIGKMITGSLDFSLETIERNIELGYQDTYKIMKKVINHHQLSGTK